MLFHSTRGQSDPMKFTDAVRAGLADDGGLFVPERLPDLSSRLTEITAGSYVDLAEAIFREFATDIPAADLRALIEKTYAPDVFPDGVSPIQPAGNLHIQELFHGPTLAFKDVALQWLGNLFEYILATRGGEMTVLAATSGDTGSAAIAALGGRENLSLFVMHPAGRISPLQYRQMTTAPDANVHNLAVEGTFDDTQHILKMLNADADFKQRVSLGAVNSVNFARILAQIVYYFDAWKQLGRPDRFRVSVPTGNFGDILAGYYAKQMGLPIERLILATNDNDILARFFDCGIYSRGDVFATLAPAMDIQVASNFERYLFERVGRDGKELRWLMDSFAKTGEMALPKDAAADELFYAVSANETQILDTIHDLYDATGYVADPHTAVGVFAANQFHIAHDETVPMVCLATAHPAKFPDAIARATGRSDLASHPTLDALADLPARCTTIPADQTAVRHFIEEHL
ncbi:MAG: threonine synthase [Phycisphaerales bacterium]|jgi:threonine synthase|nr:threonine synthase [Phycisphaerales bacterium]MBT7170751.1 threonine synthase [Phycisphaerales bacterium]